MEAAPFLEIARSLLAQPTAPFHEDRVRAEIHLQLAQLPHVQVEQDDFGNVIARYRRGAGRPRYAFAAHMDHPGYVDGKFLGGVPEAYRQKNPPTRDFGAFAMWDLPAFQLRNKRIYSRACDDLIGCATILAMFRELERSGAETACDGLFTRAEEVGFVGAIQLAKSGRLEKETTIISLETSSQRGGPVEMGEGVIIRVGDRTGIFDSLATAQLLELARELGIPSPARADAGRDVRGDRFPALRVSGGGSLRGAGQLSQLRTEGDDRERICLGRRRARDDPALRGRGERG